MSKTKTTITKTMPQANSRQANFTAANKCPRSRVCEDDWGITSRSMSCGRQLHKFFVSLFATGILTDKATESFKNGRLLKAARRHRALLAGAFLALAVALFVFKNDTTMACSHLDSELYYCSVQVQEGDTIWSIAREHMTKEWRSTREYVKAIKKLNQMKSDFIYAGMYLSIPYYQ